MVFTRCWPQLARNVGKHEQKQTSPSGKRLGNAIFPHMQHALWERNDLSPRDSLGNLQGPSLSGEAALVEMVPGWEVWQQGSDGRSMWLDLVPDPFVLGLGPVGLAPPPFVLGLGPRNLVLLLPTPSVLGLGLTGWHRPLQPPPLAWIGS